ncbi:MAG: sialidase family protein [Acidobacteriota bacterium]
MSLPASKALRLAERALPALVCVALAGSMEIPPAPPKTPSGDSAIRVVRSVQLSTDEPSARHVESALAADPRDERKLIAASMVFGTHGGVAVYASLNGGQSWVRATHGARRDPVFDGIDPTVTFDAEGNAYLLTLSEQLAAWKSTNGGSEWGEPVYLPGSWDRPWIDVDRTAQESMRGRVYVTGKLPIVVFGHTAQDVIGFSSSSDRGNKFSFPRLLLPAPEKELLNIVSALLSLPDGQLVVALQTFAPEGLREPEIAGSYPTIVSSDGGRRFSGPRPGPDVHVFGHAREGKSLLGLGGARLAVDASKGARPRKLYMAWLDVVGGFYRVKVASSPDDGATWSKPVLASPDPSATDQSNVALAVNGEGVVGVSWNDRRADPTDGCYQLYFAASGDGGATFPAEQRVEEKSTCPLAAGSDPVASEYRFKNGGDTQGLVGLPNGGFHLAWIHGGAGEMQLWSSVLTVDRGQLLPSVPARPGETVTPEAGGSRDARQFATP